MVPGLGAGDHRCGRHRRGPLFAAQLARWRGCSASPLLTGGRSQCSRSCGP